MELQKIYQRGEISRSAFSLCRQNEYVTVADLQQHFLLNKNHNYFGFKIHQELVELYNRYFAYAGNLNQSDFLKIVDNLDDRQCLIVDNYIQINILKLSARSRRAISNQVEQELNLEGFASCIFSETHFRVQKLRNIGATAIPECETFLKELTEFIFDVSNNSDEIKMYLPRVELAEPAICDEPVILNSKALKPVSWKAIVSPEQAEIITDFIVETMSSLSVRNRNATNNYLDGAVNAVSFLNKIYLKNVKAINIPNVGAKSLKELEEAFAKIGDFYLQIVGENDPSVFIEMKHKMFLNKIDSSHSIVKANSAILNHEQAEIITDFIVETMSSLSVRNRNATNNYLDGVLNAASFLDKIYLKKIKAINIPHVGAKSLKELEEAYAKIGDFYLQIVDKNDPSVFIEMKHKMFLNKINTSHSIVKTNSVFKFTALLIDENLLFDVRKTSILKRTLNIYRDVKVVKLEDIVSETSISRQRVRQVRIRIISEIVPKLNSVIQLSKPLLLDYGIDRSQNYIAITQEKADRINFIDQTCFTKQFIVLVTAAVVKEDFKIIGNLENVFIIKEKQLRFIHIWQNIYLVRNELCAAFDFQKFLDDLSERFSVRVYEEYMLDFKDYLAEFSKTTDPKIPEVLEGFCELLLNEEIGVSLNDERCIVFKQNTSVLKYKYVEEIIAEIGQASTLEVIYPLLNAKYPNHIKSLEGLRSTCQNSPNIILLDTGGVYGLKKWETEKPNTKGGTIRSMMREFIESHQRPVAIKKLCLHILKYRPNNSIDNITTSLYLDEKVIFFKNKFVGLKSKKYSAYQYKNLEDRKLTIRFDWNESYRIIADFVSINNKFPSGIGKNPQDTKSARWLSTQIRNIKLGLLDNSKTALINELLANKYYQSRVPRASRLCS